MSSALIRALRARHGLPTVDATSIEAFLAPAGGECEHTVLFFTGEPRQRAESDDVAVVLPEILRAFGGRLRGAVIDRAAEDALKPRFHVVVTPSLVITRGAAPVAVIPKIKDWADYVKIVLAALEPDAPVLGAGAPPKTTFTYRDKGASA